LLVRHPDLEGLDEAAELFAVEVPETDSVIPTWGPFWCEPLAGAPVLPAAVRLWLPDEGGFILRPLGARATEEARESLKPDDFRRVLAPPRGVHAELGFPAPKLVSNELFIELRYGMSPSVLRWLDFEDIRSGIIRIFALPGFEGDVRIVTVVDERAVSSVLAGDAGSGTRRKRLLQFLHAAAASPPAARWPTTSDLSKPTSDVVAPGHTELFPHQRATVAWMRGVEASSAEGCVSMQVDEVEFAGMTLGSEYDISLPNGGVIAHPPGSGKTRIVASLAAADAERGSPSTLVICPAHLCKQWSDEFSMLGALDKACVIDYDQVNSPDIARHLAKRHPWRRMVVDEPQDCPAGDVWRGVDVLAEEMRGSGASVWLLCGTAPSQLDTVGRLLLGRIGWHVASRQSEWRACPQLAHLIRTRFVADPPWACLPTPPLEMEGMPVVLRPRESADAAVASLAGFALDGVMLLSFGAEAAFAAAQERNELLMQMGWTCCVGTSLLPVTEHALADWESTVVQRSQQKVDELAAMIARLEADEGRDAARYLFAGGDAALAPELRFLAGAAVHVEILGLIPRKERERPAVEAEEDDEEEGQLEPLEAVSEEACAAEWNDLLAARRFEGPLQDCGAGVGALVAGGSRREYPLMGQVILLAAPPDGDFASAVHAAEASGASAVIFEADRAEARPFGYRHEQAPPRLPAAMINRAVFARLKAALGDAQSLSARLILAEKEGEAEADLGQGLLSAFIADDVVATELHRQVQALRDERERGERALRFARQMRALLEQNEAHCPVCFQSGGEAEAFAVLPDCFHVLCRPCLDNQVGHDSMIACPVCRISVARLDVVVFRAPGAGARAQEAPPPTGADGVEGEEGEGAKFNPPPRTAAKRGLEGVGTSPEELTPLRAAWEALPSKLQRLLELLRELLASGSEERVLVFTQWAVHVAYLQEVLHEHGVESLALLGELHETMDALGRFGKPGEPRVLLLSSQRHSSGINLQVARHVVIVHPYCTPTSISRESISRSQMLAFEAQAIGRVRRFPQARPVHVYRLFAAGTVEEDLYTVR